MRFGDLALPVLAIVALTAGVAAQRRPSEPPYPLSAFAADEGDFIGESSCTQCHPDVVEGFQQSGHATFSHNPKLPLNKQGCEGCHGPGKPHLDEENPTIVSYAKLTPKQANAACMRCHSDTMTKSHWQSTAHAAANLSCVSCHQIHPGKPGDVGHSTGKSLVKTPIFAAVAAPKALLKADEATLCGSCHKTEVAEFRRNSHHPIPEGRMVCSDCHDAHPSKAAKKGTVVTREKCGTCHADLAGPFAFEHDPAAGLTSDGCVECHRPHGSHNPGMLKSFSQGLCLQCHTDLAKDHYTGRSCWAAGCHVAIHGSNTDPYLLRH